MANMKRYQIPESRLPFVNAEIEKSTFGGSPHLVSSIWGGSGGGRLYFWNPDTGSHVMRKLPEGIPGAYMLRTGPDGKLYLGCGNGDLIRYNPEADGYEALVSGELSSITWGGCVTDRYAVWAASPGHVGVYDVLEDRLVNVFRPIDTEQPAALYGHRGITTPDGKVLLAIDVPRARFVVLDPETMMAVSHTPENIVGVGSTGDATFLDEQTLAAFVAGELHLMSYPEFKLLERVALPPGEGGLGGKACVVDGRFYAYRARNGELYRLDREAHAWELVVDGWADGDTAILHPWGEKDICAVTVTGMAHRLNVDTLKADVLDLESTGPMQAHALCAVPEANLIVGAPFINQRFWTIDTDTGQGRDCGRAAPGGGQINQIIREPQTGCVLMSSYTTSTVTAFDPAQPVSWPENPRVLASAESEGQMRPMALVHDGRYVWMASSPEYGTLGGALSRIDPKDGSIRIWRHLVPDQKVNALVLDIQKRRVYCSTEIFGDANSAPPTQTTGQLVAFDMDALAVVRQQEVVEGLPSVRVQALLPSGEVLVLANAVFYAWDAASGGLRELGPALKGFREVTRDSDTGDLWACVEGQVGKLTVESKVSFVPVVDEDGKYLQVVGGNLYFAVGGEVCAMDVTG